MTVKVESIRRVQQPRGLKNSSRRLPLSRTAQACLCPHRIGIVREQLHGLLTRCRQREPRAALVSEGCVSVVKGLRRLMRSHWLQRQTDSQPDRKTDRERERESEATLFHSPGERNSLFVLLWVNFYGSPSLGMMSEISSRC